MLKYLITLILLNSYIILQAQKPDQATGNGQISGIVLDAETNLPIEYATIIIYKNGTSKAINGATTNKQGQFSVKELSLDIYKVNVEFIGSKTMTFNNVTIDNGHLKINLNTILLEKSNSTLKEVTVTSSARMIENKIE